MRLRVKFDTSPYGDVSKIDTLLKFKKLLKKIQFFSFFQIISWNLIFKNPNPAVNQNLIEKKN